jgi:hypothetical protein
MTSGFPIWLVATTHRPPPCAAGYWRSSACSPHAQFESYRGHEQVRGRNTIRPQQVGPFPQSIRPFSGAIGTPQRLLNVHVVRRPPPNVTAQAGRSHHRKMPRVKTLSPKLPGRSRSADTIHPAPTPTFQLSYLPPRTKHDHKIKPTNPPRSAEVRGARGPSILRPRPLSTLAREPRRRSPPRSVRTCPATVRCGGSPCGVHAGLCNPDDYDIVKTYAAEYRGIAQYHLLATDVWRLTRLRWVTETSMLKTLAASTSPP